MEKTLPLRAGLSSSPRLRIAPKTNILGHAAPRESNSLKHSQTNRHVFTATLLAQIGKAPQCCIFAIAHLGH